MKVEPRLIPLLLLKNGSFVKTIQFSTDNYVGDPLNVISIFNDFEVDEVMLIDLDNSRKGKIENFDYLERIASDFQLPLTYGGGINSLEDITNVIRSGFEKVVVNSAIFTQADSLKTAVDKFGGQALIAGLDYREINGNIVPYYNGGKEQTNLSLENWCKRIKEIGFGEVLMTNIDREGTRTGLDVMNIKKLSEMLSLPVIAHGGASSRDDLVHAINQGASAVAAGTIFLMQRGSESIIINYPSREEVTKMFPDFYRDYEIRSFKSHVMKEGSTGKVISNEVMCPRCLITSEIPNSQISDGTKQCFYCDVHDKLEQKYSLGEKSDLAFAKYIAKVKRDGVGKKYDCILGVSGGTDSSFLAHVMSRHGLRILAVHFDNTWNSPIATSNIYAVLNKLGIDLETYVVNNEEYDDIYRSFLYSGVRDIETPTDIGFMGTLYRYAEKYGIKHIVEGHSFRTEGISPLGWLYMDGKYIEVIQKEFGTMPLRSFPNINFWEFIKWMAFSGIQRTRPLYWLDYQKEEAKVILSNEYGWKWYGGHHLENRFTAFFHTYFFPQRFGLDFRQIELSALVRSGQLSKERAIDMFVTSRSVDLNLISFVRKRLGFSQEEFEGIMNLPKRNFYDYKTYKKRFEKLKPLFWILMKLNRVPESFYIKYCKKDSFRFKTF